MINNGDARARVRVRMRGELAIELAEQRDALDQRSSAPANVSAEFFAAVSSAPGCRQRNRRNYVWNAIPAARA
jgi:hypothetical protein